MKLRFGICGLGFAGSVLMAPDLKEHPDIDLVAACDPNTDVRERFGHDYRIPTFPNLTDMLSSTNLDGVYIASPHQHHCEQVLEAAEKGLHIIIEKPLAIHMEDAQKMAVAVSRANVHLVVGPSRGNDPAIRRMRELVLSGDVGKVAMVNCWNFTDFLYRPRRPEELDTSLGGGIVYNQLPHQIDCIKTITGQAIAAVRATVGALDPERPTEGHCTAFLTLSGGAAATMVYSGYDHFDSDEFQFWLNEGGLPKQAAHGNARRLLSTHQGSEAELRVQRYGYGGPISKFLASSQADRKQSHFGTLIVTCEKADLRPSKDGVLIYGHEGVREIPAERTSNNRMGDTTIQELVDAVRGKHAALRDAVWGKETLQVCHAILESSRTGRQIEL